MASFDPRTTATSGRSACCKWIRSCSGQQKHDWVPVLALLAALASACIACAPAIAQPSAPALAPVALIDGPSTGIAQLGGLSVARDGSGGLVYLKRIGAVTHVFVSRLVGGGFQAPQQIDAALPGASSQPVIAASSGGLLLVGFINGGELYVVDRTGTTAPYTAPIGLFAGASNPSLQMTIFGKAYLAFTAAGAGGHDVRVGYYVNGRWNLESAPLDANPADDAGTGDGRPAVAAAGDGVAIVAWGEGGRIYTRRVWGTSPSAVFEQADGVAPSGCAEVSADHPVIGSGGDSSYAAVAFREVVGCGGPQQSRVFMRRLRGSQYDSALNAADGISGPGDGAADPQVAVGEFGRGFVTSGRTASHQLFAQRLGSNAAPAETVQVDSLASSAAPFGVPGTAGTSAMLIAWQRDPGIGGPDIRARFSPGSGLGPELVLSDPGFGPTDAADGLAAGGASSGDSVVAWVQGAPGSREIVTRDLLQPLGAFAAVKAFRYVRTLRPVLTWSPVRARLGVVRYLVRVDGAPVAQTTATSVRVPSPLRQGRHTWQVTAVNPAGLTSTDGRARVFVDTIRPVVRVSVSGTPKTGSRISIFVGYNDAPHGLPHAAASGVRKVVVKWGDGTSSRLRHGASHVYRRQGHFKLTVTVTDRAGNATRRVRSLNVAG